MSLNLDSKLAFVVGGSEGIGKEIARELFESGANVVILSRSETKLTIAVNEIKSFRKSSQQLLFFKALDVTSWNDTRDTIDELVKNYGCPDYLVNCAGYAMPGYIETTDIEHYRKMMDLNYFGIVHTCKAIAPHMIKAKRGKIINTSSIAGFIGLFGYTGYCASKWAVIGFSEALRRELKIYGIKVSVLAPPNTQTPGLTEENKFKSAEILKTEEKVKPVSAKYVAQTFMSHLNSNQFMIHPNFDGRLAFVLSRYTPSILNLFVKRPREN